MQLLESPSLTTNILLGGISVLSVVVNVLFFQLVKSKNNEIKYLRRKLDDIQNFLMENRG